MESNNNDHSRFKLLKLVKEALDNCDIRYWLDCGTLWGAVRDKKIISCDHDIDFGTWQENAFDIYIAIKNIRTANLTILLSPNGFTIKDQNFSLSIILYAKENDYAKIHWGTSSINSKITRLILDVLIWSTLLPHFSMIGYDMVSNRGGKIMLILSRLSQFLPSWFKRYVQKMQYLYGEMYVWIIPIKYFQKLKIINFYDMQFYAPLETRDYLKYRYGGDWMIEKADWVTSTDDGAVFNARLFHYKKT